MFLILFKLKLIKFAILFKFLLSLLLKSTQKCSKQCSKYSKVFQKFSKVFKRIQKCFIWWNKIYQNSVLKKVFFLKFHFYQKAVIKFKISPQTNSDLCCVLTFTPSTFIQFPHLKVVFFEKIQQKNFFQLFLRCSKRKFKLFTHKKARKRNFPTPLSKRFVKARQKEIKVLK